nr:uncharacterized protein LOC109173053 [Ipomoea trifida]
MPLDTADFWIQVHDLPLGFLLEKSFKSIGDFIGQFLHLDEATFNTWFRSFIRIRVRTNIAKPLVSQMWIRRNGSDWSWISFRYERLPNFCFICGLIGHTEKFYVKIFEGFNPTSEKQYGAGLRAPTRQPSPVIGNRWVVPDQDVSNTTIHSPHCNSNEVMAGTIAVNPQADHSNIPDGLAAGLLAKAYGLLKHRRDAAGITLFNEAQFQFLRTLHHQNDYWRQRAKQFWLCDSDTNSSFFHKSFRRKQQTNRINKLKNAKDNNVSKEWLNSIALGIDNNAFITYYSASPQILQVNFTRNLGFGIWTYDNLSFKVDLRDHLPEKVCIGFSAATGSHPASCNGSGPNDN